MNITEEQIRKIASQELDIKDLFPEVFNFTGWAKDKNNKNWLGYYENNILQYGIDVDGNWLSIDNGSKYNPNTDRPATNEEVQTALVNEAKKRGFVIGCKHTITNGDGEANALTESFRFDESNNKLFFNDLSIFQKGTWAEVKKEPKYVLVSKRDLYLIDARIEKNNYWLISKINKKLAIIFDTKEKAEAMNTLLDNKYKLEEL